MDRQLSNRFKYHSIEIMKEGGGKMQRLCNQLDVFNILLDYKKHTYQEIATELDVSYKTIQRYISELSLVFPILTFHGGRENGGVILEKYFVIGNGYITNDELHTIVQALLLMQSNGTDCSKLLKKIAPSSQDKEMENESIRKKREWAV